MTISEEMKPKSEETKPKEKLPAIADEIEETKVEEKLKNASDKIYKLEKCMREKDKRIEKIENVHSIVKASAICIVIITSMLFTYGLLLKTLHIIHSYLPEMIHYNGYRTGLDYVITKPELFWSFYGISIFAFIMLTIVWILFLDHLITE